MATGFKQLYPPKGTQLLDGGLNTKFEKTIIEPNESPSCQNVIFNAGSVGTRDGFKKLNTSSVGTFVCDGLYSRQGTNNAETMVAWFGGTAYTLAGTTFTTIGSAQSVATAGFRVCCAQMENHAFFGNGSITPYKYNGTDFTRHGVPAPSMPASFVTGAAGNPNGLYSYKFVNINSQSVAGNPSSASANITVALTKVEITSIPVAPQSHGVSSRRIYRTVTSGATYFLLATLNDNTTTVYSDDVADANLGAAAPSDKGEPPVYSMIVYHQGRLFMNDASNPSFLWYTDLNEPYTVASTNFLIVGDTATDQITGLGVQDDTLVIFCRKNIWLVYMQDTTPANWSVIKSKSPYTTRSPFGVINYNNKTLFPATQNDVFSGFAALAGDAVDINATYLATQTLGSNLKSDKIEPDMFDLPSTYVPNISSIVFENQVLISVTKGSAQTTNNKIYTMDFSQTSVSGSQSEAWSVWTGLNAAQFCIYGGNLYYGTSTATGFVYQQNPGVYHDDGTAIDSYFWTKEFAGLSGHESYDKDFRTANILVDLAGAYYMQLGYRTDSDIGSGNTLDIYLDPNSSTWGSLIWGSGLWGGGQSQKDIRNFLGSAHGKRIQFYFSNKNTASQRFKVHWLNFKYNLKGAR